MMTLTMVIVSVVLLSYAGFRFYRAIELLKIQTREGINDHERVVAEFSELLDGADKTMIVYDDGNSMRESVYEDQAVVDAIETKLAENPQFEIDCMFNCGDDTLFLRRFREHPRIHITRRKGERSSVHYRIIDDGRKAHISHHELGEEERYCKVIDATKASAFARRVALGEYFIDFREHHA